jgi:hypothetical protein
VFTHFFEVPLDIYAAAPFKILLLFGSHLLCPEGGFFR